MLSGLFPLNSGLAQWEIYPQNADKNRNCKFTLFPNAKLKITLPGTIFDKYFTQCYKMNIGLQISKIFLGMFIDTLWFYIEVFPIQHFWGYANFSCLFDTKWTLKAFFHVSNQDLPKHIQICQEFEFFLKIQFFGYTDLGYLVRITMQTKMGKIQGLKIKYSGKHKPIFILALSEMNKIK